LNPADQVSQLARFPTAFRSKAGGGFTALSVKTFQINIGKRCNQACRHCHVDASPARTESMSDAVMEACLRIIASVPEIETVDITGGAPELHPRFTWLVERAVQLGKHVIDRCNLTILEEPGFDYLYDFLPKHRVEIIASLPHFTRSNTDRQRGNGVFDRSISALQKLNRLGYGRELPLNLVYNPAGFYLSGNQQELEREFKEALRRRHGVVFNRLYCLNNMPISRFLEALLARGKFEEYLDLLVHAYNPATLEGLMCRQQISVGHDGSIYDCDFNQMLEIKAAPVAQVGQFDAERFLARRIQVHNHCFGCTAGSGSSCGGALHDG
jgi:radical SAM/Cys-rich protein